MNTRTLHKNSRAHDHRVVELLHGSNEISAEPGNREHELDDESSRRDRCDRRTENRDDGQNRISEFVPKEYSRGWQPLAFAVRMKSELTISSIEERINLVRKAIVPSPRTIDGTIIAKRSPSGHGQDRQC